MRNIHPTLRLSSILLAACTAAPKSAPPLTAARSVSVRVTTSDVNAPITPTFAMYRNGLDGDWQTPTPIDGGYQLAVDNDYVFVAVCASDGGGFDAETYAGTIADGNTVTVLCGVGPGTDPAPIPTSLLRGSIVQAADLSIAGYPFWGSPAGFEFAVDVAVGPVDAVATTDARVAVVHAFPAPAADTQGTMPPIDIDADGAAFQAVTPTAGVTPDADEKLGADYVYFSANGAVFLDGPIDQPTLRTIPPALIADGDEQVVNAVLSGPGESRGASSRATGASALVTDFTLPPRIQATFSADANGSVATVPVLTAPYDTVLQRVSDASGHAQTVVATKSWLAVTGAATLGFDTSAPGYDPSWIVTGKDAFPEIDVDYHDATTGIDSYSVAYTPSQTAMIRHHQSRRSTHTWR
jgi:hypothetical protein